MELKIEGISNLYMILAVLIPGFIYNGVLSHFISMRQNSEKMMIALRLMSATAFNYAICSPLIYLLYIGFLFPNKPINQGILWFIILFVTPSALGIARAAAIQKDLGARFYRWLRLRPINPVPTGWDWVFGRTDPCYILVTLVDGTEITGYFGFASMASSDPDKKDLFIEKVFRVPQDDSPWIEAEGTLGMHIDGAQISYIEFRR